MREKIFVYCEKDMDRYDEMIGLAKSFDVKFTDDEEQLNTYFDAGMLALKMTSNGLALADKKQEMTGDFSKLSSRIKRGNLGSEMLVKASKIKNSEGILTVMDATAGMGEDSFLLAAAGFRVKLYEKNPIIAALLADAHKRALEDEELSQIAARMSVHNEDSIEAMRKIDDIDNTDTVDVIYLDPMFPKRQKSGLIKKKFQLLQQLEFPCADEIKMLEAAMSARPRKLVIKRPLKGPYLAGKKADYSYEGKAIRYDCFTFAR